MTLIRSQNGFLAPQASDWPSLMVDRIMGQRQSDPQFASITEKRKPDMLRYFSQMIAHLYQNAEICEGHDWTGGERGDGGGRTWLHASHATVDALSQVAR